MSRPAKNSKSGFLKQFWSALGPGLITGAADDDPSGIATYSVAGAQVGTSLLWTAVMTWPLMAFVQMMCARVGMVSGSGLMSAFRKKFPLVAALAAILGLFLANTINVGADLAGMADAAQVLTHVNARVWIFVFAIGISWATIKLRYHQIANVLKWLALVLFAYIINAFVIHPAWGQALHDTFVPSMPRGKEGWSTLVAILGTTISPYLFFWQAAEEVEEEKSAGHKTFEQRKGASTSAIRKRRLDVGSGTFFSNLVMYFIILTSAFTLHRSGHTNVETSKDAAMALLPVAGRFAVALYTLGIVGVGLLAIPTLTGSAAYAFAEAFRWRQGLDKRLMQARSFYGIIVASTTAAVVMDFAKIRPVKALYWTAVINGVLAPFLLAGILLVASDAKLMNGQTSPIAARVVVAIAMVAMFAAAFAMFWVYRG